jgi:hypothetical protein
MTEQAEAAKAPISVRLPVEQVEWLDEQGLVLGGRAAALRLVIASAMKRGWTIRVEG